MILDQLPFAVLVVDENYNFIYSNQNFHELFHKPEKGQETLKEIIPRQFIQKGKVIEVLTLLKDMNQPQRMVKIPKFRFEVEGGVDQYFNLLILPVRVNGIFHFMFVFQDITEDQEEEISTFQQAKLMALGEMAAAISHEINNFLSILQGHIDLADMKNKDEAVGQHLQFIRMQIENIAKFSKSILNFSRQNTVDFVELSMNQVIQETMRFLQARMRKNNIQVVLDLEPGVKTIKGNPSQLQQLLINLLLNAKKAIRNQGKIIISTRNDAGKIILEIEDNGVGMTKEVASQIFNPFFTTRTEGHGLGLNICEKIVTNHNGIINFVSKRNKGTKFTITFPAVN